MVDIFFLYGRDKVSATVTATVSQPPGGKGCISFMTINYTNRLIYRHNIATAIRRAESHKAQECAARSSYECLKRFAILMIIQNDACALALIYSYTIKHIIRRILIVLPPVYPANIQSIICIFVVCKKDHHCLLMCIRGVLHVIRTKTSLIVPLQFGNGCWNWKQKFCHHCSCMLHKPTY